jgi:hypothetical protein
VPSRNIALGSGIGEPGVPTSLPNGAGTFWNLTRIALHICCSVNPVNAAPVMMNDALSPGDNPRFGEPPLKLPEGPVVKPKSSTLELNPEGTFPRFASEKSKVDERLGACDPLKPFNPEALAFPTGARSKPTPVMVAVEPGCVIAEVLVSVNMNVLVCELNSQTTKAVENWPDPTPAIVIVSARETVAATVRTAKDPKEKSSLRNLGI